MPARNIFAATEEDMPEIRALMHATFVRDRWFPVSEPPFYVRYDRCDPAHAYEQYRFRRRRGEIVSALKVYVRQLQHPDGPVPVTVLGAVCTAEKLRGRGLIAPVIQDSIEYSRSLGAKAVMIVSPRRNYYQRHGFRYFPTAPFSGRIPEADPGNARIEPIRLDDAGWMTEMFNAQGLRYGPIVRGEEYTREWVLGMRLAQRPWVGLKLLRRGRPAAYLIANMGKTGGKLFGLIECASRKRDGTDEAILLAFLRRLNRSRFDTLLPAEHALIRHLKATGRRLRRTHIEKFMYYALDDSFPIPGEEFCYLITDSV